MRTITIDAEVDLGDIDTEDLVEEICNRLEQKFVCRRGKPKDEEMKQLRTTIEPLLRQLSMSPFMGLDIKTLNDEFKLSHIIEIWNKYSLFEIQNKLP